MKFASVKELKNKTSEILRKAEKEEILITSNGKPRALLTILTEEDFEDFQLERNPAFLEMLEAAYEESIKKGGVALSEYVKNRKRRRG